MLPTRSSPYSSQRKNKPYVRRPSQLTRSGSILSTIRSIVTAPLSWWSANEEFEDINGKRKRGYIGGDGFSDRAGDGSKAKRIRMSSPPRTTTSYLDPPEVTFAPLPNLQKSHEPVNKKPNRTPEPLAPLNGPRIMSVDHILDRRTSLTGENSRVSVLGRDTSMRIQTSVPLQRDFSMQPPTSPLKLRTSLTPQPSPTKSSRREASAPPPLTSLMSNPIFVKPPPVEKAESRKPEEHNTILLGSLAQHQRKTRSPVRELSLATSTPSGGYSFMTQPQTSVRVTNIAEKTLHDLEIYKSPIVPSRYRGATAIPQFLKPRKAHVPIPMPSKDREKRPSLGMASKKKAVEKSNSKPYAGEGGLSKLLARRRAEEEQITQNKEEKDRSAKKDVGVSAGTVHSENEVIKSRYSSSAVQTLPSDKEISAESVFNPREKSSGKAGRIRITRREQLSRPTLSNDRSRNKFSASFEDEGPSEDQIMLDESMESTPARSAAPVAEEPKESTSTIFPAPQGFSFPSDSSSIVHDYENAKEPPISSLPFSFTNASQPEPTNAKNTSKASTEPVTNASEQTRPVASEKTLVPPRVNIFPPTPDTSAAKTTDFGSTAPVTPVVFSAPSQSSAPGSNTNANIPNFFANSGLLKNGSKSSASSVMPAPSPFSPKVSVPVKDANNPLWEGEKNADAKLEGALQPMKEQGSSGTSEPSVGTIQRPKSTEPKPLPFGGFNRPSISPLFGGNGPISSPPIFRSKDSTAVKMQSTGAPETPMDTNGHSPVISSTGTFQPSFGADSTFPPKSQNASSMSTNGSNEPPKSTPSPFAFSSTPPPTARSADLAPTAFTFGTPPSTGVSDSVPSPSLAFAPKPLFGSEVTSTTKPGNAEKNPFTFGAAPSASPVRLDKAAAPLFGAPATTAPAFSFGVAKTTPSTGDGQAPFGAPSFGSTRPVTPPQEVNEVRMDDSPTRDLNNGSGTETKPANTFGFGVPATPAFGSTSTNGTGPGFAFGSAPSHNPFENKGDKATGFGFNRIASAPAASTGFTFGQKPQSISTPSSNGFGAQPSTFSQNTGTASPFSFGSSAPINPFAQPSPTTPSSPSQFQPPGFNFNVALPIPNNPFNFSASQPSSPALGTSTAPQSPSGSNAPFIFGQGATSQPSASTSFPSSGSGTLFNIGAAPSSSSVGTPRQMKRLPKRGAGKR